MIDRTTKIILVVIALILFANLMATLVHPPATSAQTSFACTGELTANAWGGTQATIGGYRVDVKCR